MQPAGSSLFNCKLKNVLFFWHCHRILVWKYRFAVREVLAHHVLKINKMIRISRYKTCESKHVYFAPMFYEWKHWLASDFVQYTVQLRYIMVCTQNNLCMYHSIGRLNTLLWTFYELVIWLSFTVIWMRQYRDNSYQSLGTLLRTQYWT